MTTSSDYRTPRSISVSGDHWLEMTATLSRAGTDEFGDWLGRQLDQMEKDLYSYVTPGSLSKSLQRQSKSLASQ